MKDKKNGSGDLSLEAKVLTLLINGFQIDNVTRYSPTATLIHASRFDRLGASVKYGILFVEDAKHTAVVDTLLQLRSADNFTAILVSDHFECTECITYSHEKFFSFFGGLVNTGLILVPSLSKIMDHLGHNELVPDLNGVASELHEAYVNECLQFMLESPARRYGMERSFQSLPDTVVLSKERFMILVDCKSYNGGYGFDADSIKRFSSYVTDFNARYSSFFGPIFCFLVVSGHFKDSVDSIESRSDELYKLTNCRISCITSRDIGTMTMRLQATPEIRKSLLWKNILIDTIVTLKTFEAEIKRVEQDKLH